MALTRDQLQKMADIFNTDAAKSTFSDIQVTADDFSAYDMFGNGKLIKFENFDNPVIKLFSKLAQNRQIDQGQFFHFKSLKVAKSIIKDQAVQVSNLLSNHYNDFAEFTEFFQRLGIINQLIPNTYCGDDSSVNSRKNRSVDVARDEIFILCMSKEGHKERFWQSYAGKDTGVCLVLRFLDFDRSLAHTYDIRDVNYDAGYDFEFLNEVNHHFSMEFDRILFINGITKFARFYKRGSFSWENETRLAFDYHKDASYADSLKSTFPIHTDGNRKYISVPLKGNPVPNPLFTLDIDEVIIGYHVAEADRDELKALLALKFPSAKVWQREHFNY